MVRSAALVAAVLALAVLSAGCGSKSPVAKALATAAHPAGRCYVGIYLIRSDTQAERAAIAVALREDRLIASFHYVSRKQALAVEAKKIPALAKSLTSNPLPDSFKTVPKTSVSAYKVIAELKARKFHGVANINGSTANSLPCGFEP
jgi:cell division protein FtsX